MANLLWLQGAGDNGCTISFLNAHQPDVGTLLNRYNVNLLFHPTLSPQSGKEAMELLDRYAGEDEPVDVLVVEGAVTLGPENSGKYCLVGDRPFKDLVETFAARAGYVVAVGSCATFGGMSAAEPNPTDARGMQFYRDKPGGFLGENFRSNSGLPVVNIPGCPAHPDWVTKTLAAVLLGLEDHLELDEFHRPKAFFQSLSHRGCSRNEFYEFGEAAHQFGEKGCLVRPLGCKGIETHADCNQRLWNNHSSKTRAGSPCVGCTEPNFPDAGSGYFFETRGLFKIPKPLGSKTIFRLPGIAFMKLATPKRLKEENRDGPA